MNRGRSSRKPLINQFDVPISDPGLSKASPARTACPRCPINIIVPLRTHGIYSLQYKLNRISLMNSRRMNITSFSKLGNLKEAVYSAKEAIDAVAETPD